MQNDIVYGVESVEIATINPIDGTINNDWARMENIEEGSVSYASNTDQRTAITPEDKDAPIIFLYTPGDPDSFNFALLEISPENLARFFNIIYDPATTKVTVLATRKRANVALRLTTRPQQGVKKIFVYQNTVADATYKNNFSKTGLVSISIVASILPWKTTDNQDAAYSVQKVLEDGTVIDSTPTPGTFDTALTFATDTQETSDGVTATVAAVDPDAKFEFNKILSPIGTPNSMTLKLATVEVCVVDFPSDYLTAAFKFTDASGVVHSGVFTNGDVTLT